jgi:Zn-dependent peptidase ImmA (M78 family)
MPGNAAAAVTENKKNMKNKKNKIPNYPRHIFAINHACGFLYHEGITAFPIDPFDIIRKNGWELITYSDWANDFKLTVKEVAKVLGSVDGCTLYDEGHYTIVYNDTIETPGRIRFTLMHEIGHIVMSHLTDFEEASIDNGMTVGKFKVLERESDIFASNFLAPVPVVDMMRPIDLNGLETNFGLSLQAAAVRLNTLEYDRFKMTRVSDHYNTIKNYYAPYIKERQNGMHWNLIPIYLPTGNLTEPVKTEQVHQKQNGRHHENEWPANEGFDAVVAAVSDVAIYATTAEPVVVNPAKLLDGASIKRIKRNYQRMMRDLKKEKHELEHRFDATNTNARLFDRFER